MAKITAIFGGGDWTDASCVHLVLPDGVDFGTANLFWKSMSRPEREKYNFSIELFLKALGAREPTEDELEEVDDY